MSTLKYKSNSGFNLIELLIILAILAVLVNLALPGLAQSVERNQARVAINEIKRAITLTRYTAINNGVITTLCRSNDGRNCGGQWQQGFIVFTDSNADRVINGNDRLIRIFPELADSGTLKFRAFQNKQYLQMTPQGFTNYQNGNFTFCPKSNDVSLAQQVIVNRSGRTYFASDTDGDGIKEGANGKAISCD
jgi:type IV fimbrial biogenesis protein FimT